MRITRSQNIAIGFAAIGLVAVLGACGGGTTISTSGGDSNDSKSGQNTATLPADWPSDVPTPTGLALKNAIALGTPEGRTFSGSWTGTGEAGAVYTEMTGKLTANGYTSSGAFDGGGSGSAGGGVSAWKKGNTTIQLVVLTQDGKVIVNETAIVGSG